MCVCVDMRIGQLYAVVKAAFWAVTGEYKAMQMPVMFERAWMAEHNESKLCMQPVSSICCKSFSRRFK